MPARTWALPGLSFYGRAFRYLASHWPGLAPALLTTGGRRRTRPAGSDSCAGLPRPLLRGSKVQTGFQRSTEPLRKPIWRLTVDHLHFRSPLTCRLEVMTGGKRASHV